MRDSRKVVQVVTDDHSFSLGYDAANGLYTLVDLTRFYLVSKSDLNSSISSRISLKWSDDPNGLIITIDEKNKLLVPVSAMTYTIEYTDLSAPSPAPLITAIRRCRSHSY